MPYATRQHQAVLEALAHRQGQAHTAAALTQELHRDGARIGLATVYRQLEKLEQQGLVHKIQTEDGAFYQYCDQHAQGCECFLLRCERCGRIVHLDCSHLQALCRHLEAEHHFRIDPRRTVLTGRCDRCAGEEAACGSI